MSIHGGIMFQESERATQRPVRPSVAAVTSVETLCPHCHNSVRMVYKDKGVTETGASLSTWMCPTCQRSYPERHFRMRKAS